jgi:tripartite-type tricarboxylate transporter receptor subunit TctC
VFVTALGSAMQVVALSVTRRQVLSSAMGACALATMPTVTRAQSFPTRPVRLIVGQAAGSGSDVLARLVAQWLSERLGQRFIVENRPGAGGNIGAEAVVRSPADGHTLLLITSTNAINTALYDNLSFNVVRDISAVASVTLTPYALVVNPAFMATTVSDFVDYAKANPGKVNMASGGNGSVSHVSGELFKQMAGVDVVHVPYRGSTPAHVDLIGGQVQVMFDAMTSSIEHIKSGKLRVLAVTSATRSELLPNVPTVGDFVSGYEVSAWLGLGAPANTPVEVIDLLNKEVNLALADTRIRSRLIELGGSVLASSSAKFAKLIAEDAERWRKVVTFGGLKP